MALGDQQRDKAKAFLLALLFRTVLPIRMASKAFLLALLFRTVLPICMASL